MITGYKNFPLIILSLPFVLILNNIPILWLIINGIIYDSMIEMSKQFFYYWQGYVFIRDIVGAWGELPGRSDFVQVLGSPIT